MYSVYHTVSARITFLEARGTKNGGIQPPPPVKGGQRIKDGLIAHRSMSSLGSPASRGGQLSPLRQGHSIEVRPLVLQMLGITIHSSSGWTYYFCIDAIFSPSGFVPRWRSEAIIDSVYEYGINSMWSQGATKEPSFASPSVGAAYPAIISSMRNARTCTFDPLTTLSPLVPTHSTHIIIHSKPTTFILLTSRSQPQLLSHSLFSTINESIYRCKDRS